MVENWPARSARRGGAAVVEEQPAGPAPGQPPLDGARWLLVWNRGPDGECCCWRGTVRTGSADGAAVGVPGSCTNPGKHPWSVRVDGRPLGFVHGAADAVEWDALADLYGPVGGARQAAVVLDGLLVVDLDGERAVRDFARVAGTVPRERILGVSSTPRGFHVWLDCPGWSQRAVNRWMQSWLAPWGRWHGTDERAVGRRGFLLDVRTGENRYVVWPGGDRESDRRWLDVGDFGRTVARLRAGMPEKMLVRPGESGDGVAAPWAVDTRDEWVAGFIERHRGGTEIQVDDLAVDGSDRELERTWAELERWLARLEQAAPGSGRNNLLNQISYHAGARCVAAGHSPEAVRARLVEVGENVGTHGVGATVDSGLRAGVQTVTAQLAGSVSAEQGKG